MAIAANALPNPSTFQRRPAPVRRRSQAGSLVFGEAPDPDLVPRRWQLTWTQVPGATADAIRAHYRTYCATTWTFREPRTGEEFTVVYASPPQIRWSTGAVASVAVEIEDPLAH